MTFAQGSPQVNIDQLIAGVAQLETPDLETFAAQVSMLLARRKTTTAHSRQETELLEIINRSLPEEVEKRYSALQDRVHDETITPAEHEELTKLVDITEMADAERLQALITLSKVRQVSLPDLMQQLGIYPPPIRG